MSRILKEFYKVDNALTLLLFIMYVDEVYLVYPTSFLYSLIKAQVTASISLYKKEEEQYLFVLNITK